MADLERDTTYVDDTLVDANDADVVEGEHHATTGGSAVAGAITGGVVGLAGGPIAAVAGVIGGAIVGAAAERIMHTDDDGESPEMDLADDRVRDVPVEGREREAPGPVDDRTP